MFLTTNTLEDNVDTKTSEQIRAADLLETKEMEATYCRDYAEHQEQLANNLTPTKTALQLSIDAEIISDRIACTEVRVAAQVYAARSPAQLRAERIAIVKATSLTQETLREWLIYDETTGEFTWRKATSNRTKTNTSAITWSRSRKPKPQVRLFYNLYFADKLAFLYMLGVLPTDNEVIIHLDGQDHNTAWDNLEIGPAKQKKTYSSGVTGVCWNKQARKWQATISHNKRQVLLGQFIHLDHAVKARYEAELKYNTQDATRPTSAALYMRAYILLL